MRRYVLSVHTQQRFLDGERALAPFAWLVFLQLVFVTEELKLSVCRLEYCQALTIKSSTNQVRGSVDILL